MNSGHSSLLFIVLWILVLTHKMGVHGFVLTYFTPEVIQSSSSDQVIDKSDGGASIKSGERSSAGLNSSEEDYDGRISLRFSTPSDGFFHASVVAASVIVVSEIGDKTFFIAVILAMKHSRIMVFTGALTALILMTALSAGLGQVSTIIPRVYIHYLSVALFVVFGLKMIAEGYSMTSTEKGEYDEVQKSIQSKESKLINDAASLESGSSGNSRGLYIVVAMVFFEAFTMTFLAEWGDRSQLTTIILAARENVYGVIFGANLGHTACTLLAVLGGRVIADRISVKAVTVIGGVVFLVFAAWALFVGPETNSRFSLTDEQMASTFLPSLTQTDSIHS